ncbi:MAG: T9SS type A sorting domain-containing protein [Bacteroidetes bacterium]|nr:T9SS type A sorting domain-containing protein [Bacteroidota bacterium]
MYDRFFLLISCLFLFFSVEAQPSNKNAGSSQLSAGYSQFQFLDAPAFRMWFENNGNIQNQSATGGIEYPKNSDKVTLFCGGFAVSGYKEDSLYTAWMTSSSRIEEWQPGNISNDGFPVDPNTKKFRVFKYKHGDVLTSNPDIADWPVELGADFHDYNHNGIYDPQKGDLPKIFGSEMIWFVINDGVAPQSRLMGSKPMGLEAQVSAFWVDDKSEVYNHSVILIYKLINKGKHQINDMIFSLWSDPDVGRLNDDMIGVDTTRITRQGVFDKEKGEPRSLAYCYNETNNDADYGSAPPALGQGFLLGPQVQTGQTTDTAFVFGHPKIGFKELPMDSFVKFARGDPTLPYPFSATEARNYQKGYKFNGTSFIPYLEGIGGTSSDNPRIVHPGYPEQGTGWRDGRGEDKSMLISSRPFTMAVGDTQVIMATYLVGKGTDNLNSIFKLRSQIDVMKTSIDKLLRVDTPEPAFGTLELDVKNQFNQPIKEFWVNVTPFNSTINLEDGFLFKTEREKQTLFLYGGDYWVSIISNPKGWGILPDTTDKVVSITKSSVSSLNFKVNEQPGYKEEKWENDPISGQILNWQRGVKGDTTLSTTSQTNWTGTNGTIRLSSSYKGQWTLQTTVDLSEFDQAGLSFTISARLRDSDTFRVQIRNQSAENWITVDEFRTMFDVNFVRHNYDLPSILSFSEPIEIRFRFIKKSSSASFVYLDDFLIAEDVGVGVESEPVVQPSAFQLLSAYPNPFNPSTTLRWVQSHAGEVNLRVFNLLGQQVMSLPVTRPAGEQIAELDFSKLASGVYLVNAEARGEQTKPIRVVLIK